MREILSDIFIIIAQYFFLKIFRNTTNKSSALNNFSPFNILHFHFSLKSLSWWILLSSALITLKEKLTERGLKVFVVPEIPTLTMEGGGMVIYFCNSVLCLEILGIFMRSSWMTWAQRMSVDFKHYWWRLWWTSKITSMTLLSSTNKPAVILMERGN